MTPKISVIVPVYNTEQYLRRCIDSVLAQTYQDFELLLIDDGSTDSSGAICDEYAARDSRVRVFHKVNGGVSSARNVGLDNARGEWVTFVDSDDYIEENFLKSFEGNLDADLVVGNTVLITLPAGNRTKHHCIPFGCYKDIEHFISSYLSESILRVPWGKMYKTGHLSDLRFNENVRIGEDLIFNLQYFQNVLKISVLNNGIHKSSYVYMNPNDSVKKYEMSVETSVYYLSQIIDAYKSLNIECMGFEGSVVPYFYNCCTKDLLVHGDLWYKNKIIRKYSLRRSAHLGILQWTRTWLSFHGFYRLKLFMAKRHAY